MLFNSYVFIFSFLPVTLTGYFLLHHFGKPNLSKVWLILCSLYFYAYFNFSYLWIILLSIAGNHLICRFFRYCPDQRHVLRKLLFSVGLILNIGLLFVYKYLDFVFEIAAHLTASPPIVLGLVLPLGISFFTFQQISYLIDSYYQRAPAYTLLDYALFVTFFPQLIAGPIVLHNEMIPQFASRANHTLCADNLAKGLYIFSRGLAKKVLVADSFGKIVTFGYGNIQSLSSFTAILTILSYSFQIYFDFSGYCDMASGIAWMFNIRLPVNFNSPYKATNISDFWKRWHKTLTRFLTQYIYIPLGGSRCSKARTCCNVFLVFLISGIWHGAGFTFILWGCLHGIAMIVHRLFKSHIDKLPRIFTWLITFVFVNLSWVYFRAESVSEANQLIARVASGGFTIHFELAETLLNIIPVSIICNLLAVDNILVCCMTAIMIFTILVCLLSRNIQEKAECFRPSWGSLISTGFLLVWSILSLSGVSTFLYFNF